MSVRKYRTWDAIKLEYYKKRPKEIKKYLAIALEEYQKDGDEKAFLHALSFAARVQGFSNLSKATGLNREHLYRALSTQGDPRLSTFMQVISALGLSLSFK